MKLCHFCFTSLIDLFLKVFFHDLKSVLLSSLLSSLDARLCQNYRPIANLSFLSKTLERLVSLQLLSYLEQSGLLPSMQSCFRAHHSTETALLSLLSDI